MNENNRNQVNTLLNNLMFKRPQIKLITNTLTDDKNLALSKLKAFADDNFIVA